MKRVLVISPHPDDEAIGCGGTLRCHAAQGDRVETVFLSSGEKGGHGRPADETVAVREREARDASAILGIADMEFWRMADGEIGANGELAERLAAKFRATKPDVIYAPYAHDMHADHRATASATRAALDLAGLSVPVWMYEVWTPLREIFHVVDISSHIDTKLAAIRAYRSQCEHVDFVEAFRGLARYRGEMHCWPGGDYAEVFTLLNR